MIKKSILALIVSLSIVSVSAQSDTEFWFAAPDVSSAHNYDRPIKIWLSSFQQPCKVTVSLPAFPAFTAQTYTLLSNTTISVDLTTWIDNIECKPGNTVNNGGIRIVSDNLVAAYYEINGTDVNPEMFSLKGRNALGTHFFISSQYFLDNNSTYNYTPAPYSSFNIVATEDNTLVTITPSKNIVGHAANLPFSIILNRGQTYAAIASSQSASQHLQGSILTSSKPVAVTLADDLLFGDHYGGGCADLAGDQTVPVNVLGNEYIAFKGDLRYPYDKLYILATTDGTSVNQDGVNVATLNKGESKELPINTAVTYIQCSLPVYAYQLSGSGCEAGSAILPKINCTGSTSVSVARSTNEPFVVTLLVKNGGQNDFLVNGAGGIITSANFSIVPNTGGQWFWARVSLPLSGYPNGKVIKINNTTTVFQMGALQGDYSGSSFGYFSDFNSLQVNANVDHSSSCNGSKIQFSADSITGAIYSWNGPDNFVSSQRSPVISNVSQVNSGKYILNVSLTGCGNRIDTVTVSVFPKYTSSITKTICEGDSYSGHNITGVYVSNLQSVDGCDSTVTLNLQVNPKKYSTVKKTICDGDSYLGHNTSGTYTVNLVSSNGCDSIVTLNLLVNPKSFFTINKTICEGDTYLGHNSSGTFITNLISSNGCDSIVTLNLEVVPKSYFTINKTICQGDNYLGYNTSGVYVTNLVSSKGCDSIVTLNLQVNPKLYSTINKTICEGDSYLGYNKTGAYVMNLLSSGGCDSIVTLQLQVNPKRYSTINKIICEGDTFLGHNSSGSFVTNLVSSMGCDSIVTLNLQVNPKAYSTIEKSICKGESYLGYNKSGVFTDTLIAGNGCDSIRTLTLTVNQIPKPDLGLDTNICNGEILIISPGIFSSYLWQDGSVQKDYTVTEPGTYSVIVTNNCGNAKDEIVIAKGVCKIYFPNAFTPNEDGENDVFKILNANQITDFYLAIYNRWGEKVFETRNVKEGWNGKIRGKNADMGAYVWFSEFTQSGIGSKLKGTVVLVR